MKSGKYIFDGSRICYVIAEEKLNKRTVSVCRWVTKTGKLYQNGMPYFVYDDNIMMCADSYEEIQNALEIIAIKVLGKKQIEGTVEDEADEEEEDSADFLEKVYLVRKTVFQDSGNRFKIEGVFRSKSSALKKARKLFFLTKSQEECSEDDAISTSDRFQITLPEKRILIEVTENSVKD